MRINTVGTPVVTLPEQTLEVVMTGGMDNPVDVAFTAGGERILTATFLEHPRLGRRDAIVHAIYGGVYGKPHAVVEGHPHTGDLMPTLCDLGPAAPAGLARYTSSAFGPGYRDNFFVAQFNMNKVTRHVLRASGATYTTRDADFVTADKGTDCPDGTPTPDIPDPAPVAEPRAPGPLVLTKILVSAEGSVRNSGLVSRMI